MREAIFTGNYHNVALAVYNKPWLGFLKGMIEHNLKTIIMKKYLKTIGIVTLVAGALSYPAYRLYKYAMKKRAEAMNGEEGEEEHLVKAFAPAYRGKHKPHHRQDHNNGNAQNGNSSES